MYMVRKNIYHQTLQSGQTALIISVFFALISTAVVGSVSLLGYYQLKSAEELVYSKQAYAYAESGVDVFGSKSIDAKFLTTDTVPTGATYDRLLDSSTQFQSGDITISGEVSNRFRNISISASLVACRGLVFQEGVQAGFLGAMLNNGAVVQHQNDNNDIPGNLFSNGHVEMIGQGTNPYVSGYAHVAGPTSPSLSGVSNCPTITTTGGTLEHQYMQSAISTESTVSILKGNSVSIPFYSSATGYVTHITLYPQGATGTISVAIQKGSTNIVSKTNIDVAGELVEIDMPSGKIVYQDEQYELVVKNVGSLALQFQTGAYSAGMSTGICIPPSNPQDTACSGSYSRGNLLPAFKVYFGAKYNDTNPDTCGPFVPRLTNIKSGGMGVQNDQYTISAPIIEGALAASGKNIRYWYSKGSANFTGEDPCPADSSQDNTVSCLQSETLHDPILLGVPAQQSENTWQKTVWDFKRNAADGGAVSGLPSAGLSLSGNVALTPMKINGNLIVNNNTTLYLLGNINAGVSGDTTKLPFCSNSNSLCSIKTSKGNQYGYMGLPSGTTIYYTNTVKTGSRCPSDPSGQECPIVHITGDGKFTGNNVIVRSVGGAGAMIFDGVVDVGVSGGDTDNIQFSGLNSIYLISTAPVRNWSVSLPGTINVINQSGGNVIVFAPRGEVRVASGSENNVVALSGAGVIVAKASKVQYSSTASTGIVPIGGSGGFFQINSYKEVE